MSVRISGAIGDPPSESAGLRKPLRAFLAASKGFLGLYCDSV
ncbi:MAG: hypothetical protein G01um101416_939 [Microgenomates group bacterium Gr01-1014_16]|nr:MAG: hypothetical protein G01um101416_939 [Microgenomates group bacterium Gr01-1014_16]